jgi:uncharacterized protein YkwD
MGLDTDKILSELPDLKDILLNGLPPLVYSERLKSAASSHTGDMAANGYYSHVSRDGRTWEQRILDAGYLASVSGESLGMLGFSNYLQPAAAVEALFKNIFKDELRPDRKEKRNILSHDFEDAGIGMGSGVVILGGSRLNAYLVTCNFGKSAVALLEEQFMALVNEARRDPLAMAQSMGLDPDAVVADFPEMAEVLKAGLPLLQYNRLLGVASEGWLADVMEKGFVFPDAGNDPSTEDRVMSHGYLPLAAAGSIGIRPLAGSVSSAEAIRSLFEDFFKAELDPARTDGRLILEAGLKEASVRLGVGDVAFREGEATSLSYTVVIIAGSDAGPQVEGKLLLLINKARANPGEMIEEAGFDLDQARRDLPWLEDVLAEGLPDLWHNERLRSAARSHTIDMAGRNYFSGVSPEGGDHNQRILSAGYEASSAGEVLSTVSYGAQGPDELAWQLFRGMLNNELDPAGDGPRVIFGPDFTETGIGVGGAIFYLDSISGPFAVVTVDGAARMSGESPREAAEMLFLELVNEARADPLAMAAAIGMDPDSILAVVRGWGDKALFGLDPVYLNEKLWSAARLHTDDMIERGYYSHLTLPLGSISTGSDVIGPPGGPFRPGPSGKGFRDRILEQGYIPMVCGEFLGAIDLIEEPFPDAAVIALFMEQFLLEINPEWTGERLILNPSFQEIGIGLRSGTVSIEGKASDVYVIAVDFATSYEGVEGSLFGVSY